MGIVRPGNVNVSPGSPGSVMPRERVGIVGSPGMGIVSPGRVKDNPGNPGNTIPRLSVGIVGSPGIGIVIPGRVNVGNEHTLHRGLHALAVVRGER